MSDPYLIDRLSRLSNALGHLSSAFTALKKAHVYIPEGCGDERSQIVRRADLQSLAPIAEPGQ